MNQTSKPGVDQSDVSEQELLEEIAEVLGIPEGEESTAPRAPSQGDSDTEEDPCEGGGACA